MKGPELACDEKVLADTSRKERGEYGEVLMSCIERGRVGGAALSTGDIQAHISSSYSNHASAPDASVRPTLVLRASLLSNTLMIIIFLWGFIT